jgi:hypothetical protein
MEPGVKGKLQLLEELRLAAWRTGKAQPPLVGCLSKNEGLMERELDINPSPIHAYTTAVQHLLNGWDPSAVTAAVAQDTPTPDTVSPV